MEGDSQESLEKRHCRKTFNPTRSFASATRIINQHLFGIQGLGGSKSGNFHVSVVPTHILCFNN